MRETDSIPELQDLNDVADMMLGLLTVDKVPLKHGEVLDVFTGQELEDQFERIVYDVDALVENSAERDRHELREEILSSVEDIMALCIKNAFACACSACGAELKEIFPDEE